MKIGIDARLYGLEHAGIGRYVENLIEHLLDLDKKNQYTFFLRRKYYKQLRFPKNVTKIEAEIQHYSFKEQLVMGKLLKSVSVDLVHFPHFNVPLFYNQPFVVTIHDLLWHQFKGLKVTTLSPLLYLIKYLGYRQVVNHAINSADKIIVPSNWVKLQLLQKTGVATDKIVVTYEGIEEMFEKTIKPISLKSFLPSLNPKVPIIVYTGSAYPHKNLRTLIQAVKKINQSIPLQLVFVSARSVFLDELKRYVVHEKCSRQVFFAECLTDRELVSLYKKAEILVHPSRSEGFGLTGLEAMAVGLPVLASGAGALPEIYGNAAEYFSPSSIKDLTNKITQLLKDKDLQRKLKSLGKKRVHQFSWERMAKQTLKVYQLVAKQSETEPRLRTL